MATRFESALAFTREEHNQAFERFANAFLVGDYPELRAVGAKHDGAIDARVVVDGYGKPTLVVQSCLSPKGRAKSKILNTVKTLESRASLPPVLVYCTSALIGDALDDLVRDLRVGKNLVLEIRDAAWLSQRELTKGRGELCARYASEVLAPLSQASDPNVLYAGILTEDQQRLVFQYLDAQRLDFASGGNITKQTFSALVLCVLDEQSATKRGLKKDEIVASICDAFPISDQQRIREIVLGRVDHLDNRKVIHFDVSLGGYVISAAQAEKLSANLRKAKEIDEEFRVSILRQIDSTCIEREIDYEFDRIALSEIGHLCILWHMKGQADRFVDPFAAVSDAMFADRLVRQYVEKNRLKIGAKSLEDALQDVLPHSLYALTNSKDESVQEYLRAKADLLIRQSMLQVTPDLYEACRNVLGNDIIYLDTSALIRCVAEYFSPDGQRPLTVALKNAQSANTRCRVLRTHIDELIAHIRGPVLLEWENHIASLESAALDAALWTAPTLIKVIYAESLRRGRAFRALVEEVIGSSNEWENAKEFLYEELGVEVEEAEQPEDNAWWQRVFGLWLANKRRSPKLSNDRFELLVRNDVNAFTTVVQLRKRLKNSGDNYGQKVWLLTFDTMYWRISGLMNEAGNHLLQVGMSMDYLINYVRTAAQAGMIDFPEGVLPAIVLLDEAEPTGTDCRDLVAERWLQPGERRYMRERRLRDLVHEIKAMKPGASLDEGLDTEEEINDDIVLDG